MQKEHGVQLQVLTAKLIDNLTSIQGTNFEEWDLHNDRKQQQLYDDCKAIIEHLDVVHCLEADFVQGDGRNLL